MASVVYVGPRSVFHQRPGGRRHCARLPLDGGQVVCERVRQLTEAIRPWHATETVAAGGDQGNTIPCCDGPAVSHGRIQLPGLYRNRGRKAGNDLLRPLGGAQPRLDSPSTHWSGASGRTTGRSICSRTISVSINECQTTVMPVSPVTVQARFSRGARRTGANYKLQP